MPRTSTLMQDHKKAIECLECPERWPRPINGNGHFRERCDVIRRHLARLWNFGTLRPKINPCPIDQPHPCHALPHSWRNTKKQSNVLNVPNGGPAPWTDMDTSGSVVTSLSVTWQGYVILGHHPEINPCPMEQPQPRCALPHSCRNPKKRLSIWHIPFRDVSAVCSGLRNVHIRKFTCMRRTTTRSC